MNCKKCGFPIKDGDSFCTNCGAPIEKASTFIPDELMKKEETPIVNQEVRQETNNVSKFGFDTFGVTEKSNQSTNQTMNNSLFGEVKSTISPMDTITSTPVEEVKSTIPSMDAITSTPVEEVKSTISPMDAITSAPVEEVKSTISSMDTITSVPVEEVKSTIPSMNTITSAPVEEVKSTIPSMDTITSAPVNNNQNSNMTSTYSPSDKKKGSLLPLIIIVIVILVGVIGLFAGKMIFDNKDKDDNNTNQAVSKTIKINFEGFSLSLPVDYMYEIKDDTLFIGDEEGTWVTELYIIDGSYSNILSNKSMLKTELEKSGYQASEAVIKNLGSIDWITSEISMSGQNGVMGYSRATATKVFGALGYTTENNFDYNTLEKLGKVLSTFEYSEQSTHIESGFDKNIIKSIIPTE